jgi:dienelactone hydrolase
VAGWRALPVRAHGSAIDAAVLGDGEVGVVFANDSRNSSCDWVGLAQELARRGLRPLLFEYASRRQAAQEMLAAARALRSAGARRVAAIGASLGGRAVVQAAARDPEGLVAAVALSAERRIGPYPEILPDARRVRIPVLHVSSSGDLYTNRARDTRQLHNASPARGKRILVVPGFAHGVALLEEPRVRAAAARFLTAAG